MADLVFVALTIGLFALLAALVNACDGLVGFAEPEGLGDRAEPEPEAAIAGANR